MKSDEIALKGYEQLLNFLSSRRRKAFRFSFGMPTLKKGETKMVEITINNEQKIKVTLTPITPAGNPAKLDGIPKWTIINGLSAILPSEDGLSCELISEDNTGDTVYLVSADADLGDGIENITDTITLHVQNAKASSLGLTIGTAEPK